VRYCSSVELVIILCLVPLEFCFISASLRLFSGIIKDFADTVWVIMGYCAYVLLLVAVSIHAPARGCDLSTQLKVESGAYDHMALVSPTIK